MEKDHLRELRYRNLLKLMQEMRLRGMGDNDMAAKWGVPDALVSQWKTKRRGIGEQSARKIEKNSSLLAYSLDREDFDVTTCKEGSGAPDSVIAGPDIVVYYPILGRVPAGNPKLCIEAARHSGETEYIAVSKKYGEDSFFLRVYGDSMAPLFSDGALVLVDPGWKPAHNDIVVVRDGNEEGTVKRLKVDGGEWYLVPENPRYPIKPLGNQVIVGVVMMSVQQYH
ncbi:MAG: S24 family peptidase [Acidithiobacillus sp.]|jgi:SOS-response transcriptional repressor LexA|nr:S24 family peptidase [Acidithiobacillus sp.]